MIITANWIKLSHSDLSDNTAVAAAGSNTQTLTPVAGKIYVIRNIFYNAADPAGSGAGTHTLSCRQVYVSSDRVLFEITATTGNDIKITQVAFVGDSSEAPSNAREQALLQKGGQLWASNSYPLKFTYTNNTDVQQAQTRTLEILYTEHDEAA